MKGLAVLLVLSLAFAWLLCYGAMRSAEKIVAQQTTQEIEALK